MLKLAVFDMDGLMFDTEAVTLRSYIETGKKMGIKTTREQFLKYLGMNSADIRKIYHELFGEDFDADGFYKAVGDHRLEILKNEGIPVKKGLTELIDTFENMGIPMAVASGSNEDVIRENLEKTGLSGKFREIVCSGDVGRGKPCPDVYLYLSEKFGVSPEETIVLEDSANGIRAGLSAGAGVIAVPDLLSVPEELAKKCLAVLPDLGKAAEMVRGFVK